jgi:hypothetical protein
MSISITLLNNDLKKRGRDYALGKEKSKSTKES